MESWRRNPLVFWAFNLPPTLWLILFFLIPLTIIWVFSFGEKRGVVDIEITWTLENYIRALEPIYLKIFTKSFWYAGLTTFICLVVAFPIALFITFAPERWEAGQNSALDTRAISEGRDVGNVVVQRKTENGLKDIPYDVTFAFVFHAFRPEGTINK